MNDGARTRDSRNHNPGLYQLSYVHHTLHFYTSILGAPGRTRTCYPQLRRLMLYPDELRAPFLVGVEGFEPTTPCSQSRCATRLRHTPKITHLAGLCHAQPKGELYRVLNWQSTPFIDSIYSDINEIFRRYGRHPRNTIAPLSCETHFFHADTLP